MTITLYDSLTHKKKDIQDLLIDGKISLYGCGVTVYDHCHIGHGRVFVVYDSIIRYLKACSLDVISARNITDIDDKIIKKALDSQKDFTQVTKQFTESMHQDIKALGCLEVDHEPRATDHIQSMIVLIEKLIEKGYAYVLDSEVFFHVEKFEDYGKLSGQKLKELNFGHRIEARNQKKHPADFTLWKPAKEGEPSWSSPWSQGRPGWHIECSAMIEALFKQTLSIHLGGADLKFPHHENEIAQSECCYNRPLAALWLHIGFVQVKNEQENQNEKMSKSLGNFVTLKDILSHYCANTCRLFYLTTHYRQPLVYSRDNFEHAKNSYQTLYQALSHIQIVDHAEQEEIFQDLLSSLSDDLNYPKALAHIYQLLKKFKNLEDNLSQMSAIKRFCEQVLGLTFDVKAQETISEDIYDLAKQREQYRSEKKWAQADHVRQKLAGQGWEVVDTKDGFELKKLK